MKILTILSIFCFTFLTHAKYEKCPETINVEFNLEQKLNATLNLIGKSAHSCSYRGYDNNEEDALANISISLSRFERNKGILSVKFLKKKIMTVSKIVIYNSKSISFDFSTNRGSYKEKKTKVIDLSSGAIINKTNNQSIF